MLYPVGAFVLSSRWNSVHLGGRLRPFVRCCRVLGTSYRLEGMGAYISVDRVEGRMIIEAPVSMAAPVSLSSAVQLPNVMDVNIVSQVGLWRIGSVVRSPV